MSTLTREGTETRRRAFRLEEAQPSPTPHEKRLSQGHRCVTWRPADAIGAATRAWLYEMLVEVSSETFGADMTEYWQGRKANGYFDQLREFTLVLNGANEVIGWTGHQVHCLAGFRCVFLDSTGILPAYRGHGFTDRLQTRAIAREVFSRPFDRLYLVVRTESPVIYQLLRTGVGKDNIFPTPNRATPSYVRSIAAEVAVLLGQADKFDEERMRLTGAYSDLEALYGELPKCRDERLNEFFVQNLHPVDAFLVVAEATAGRVVSHAATRALRRSRDRPRRT